VNIVSLSISGIPDDIVRTLADRLMGTCDNLQRVFDSLGVEIPDGFEIEDVISDLEVISVERCPGSQWWMESCELVDDDLNDVGCPSCRPNCPEESGDE